MLLNFANSSRFEILTECKSAIIFCSKLEVPELTGSGSSSFSKGKRTLGVFSNLHFLMLFFHDSEGLSKLGCPMVDPVKASWIFYKSKPRLGSL